MSKEDQLQELESELLAADPTPELRQQAVQLVFGHGDVDADILFVGEAPGKQEDIHGQPFIGASGKFLDEMLATVGLERKEIYITNIVKYRPPKNRDPSKEEKQVMWPYLVRQIEIIKPKVVVTLGRHSGQAFIKDLVIGDDHGQPKSVHGILDGNDESIIILPLYHPAAALYNGSLRAILIEDFQTVANYIT